MANPSIIDSAAAAATPVSSPLRRVPLLLRCRDVVGLPFSLRLACAESRSVLLALLRPARPLPPARVRLGASPMQAHPALLHTRRRPSPRSALPCAAPLPGACSPRYIPWPRPVPIVLLRGPRHPPRASDAAPAAGSSNRIRERRLLLLLEAEAFPVPVHQGHQVLLPPARLPARGWQRRGGPRAGAGWGRQRQRARPRPSRIRGIVRRAQRPAPSWGAAVARAPTRGRPRRGRCPARPRRYG